MILSTKTLSLIVPVYVCCDCVGASSLLYQSAVCDLYVKKQLQAESVYSSAFYMSLQRLILLWDDPF